MSETQPIQAQLRASVGEPAGALVLLHGRGTDEHDLLPFAQALDPEQALVAVTPRGPLSLPPGGRHWYVVQRVGFPDPPTFRDSYRLLDEFLSQLPERIGVPWQRTILGGFSQGAAMAYALGLGRGRPSPAGILAASGFIPSVPDFHLDLGSRPGLPVMIYHGSSDQVISVDFAEQARSALNAAGLQANEVLSPLGHTIDPSSVASLRSWVQTVTGAAASA